MTNNSDSFLETSSNTSHGLILTPSIKAVEPTCKKPKSTSAGRLSSSSEADIQKDIIGYLIAMQRLGKVAWFARVNSGGAFTGKRFVSFYTLYHNNLAARTKGIADIILQLANGRFAALEIKAHKGIATPEQLAFIDTVNTHGGKAAIVRSISDVYTLLFQE